LPARNHFEGRELDLWKWEGSGGKGKTRRKASKGRRKAEKAKIEKGSEVRLIVMVWM
jgi:hypothetical protein